jgi:phage-related protein/DNA-binding XRE family transcriptional regulator
MNWKITFFNKNVEQETLSFPAGILANLLQILEMIEEYGPTIGKPYTAPMGKGLSEVRAKGKEGIGRSLFCTIKGKEYGNSSFTYKKDSKNTEKGAGSCQEKNEGDLIMKRTTFEEFKKKALKDPEVKAKYDALAPEYQLRKKLIALRKKAGLTQKEIAKKLHTNKSNISRLESVSAQSSPKLSTIEEYAKATGHEVEVNFVPMKQ